MAWKRKKPRDLIDLDVEEVSLVDVPASKKKFLLIKRREEMKELINLLKKFTGKEIEEEVFEGVDEKEKSQLEDNLMTIDKYRDSFPGELNKAVSGIVTALVDYLAEEPEADVKKVGAKLSKDTVKKLRDIISQLESIIGTSETSEEKKTEKSEAGGFDEFVKKLETVLEKFEKKVSDTDSGDKEEGNEDKIVLTEQELQKVISEAIKSELEGY